MTDIYHEVQEDLRRDRMKALWARYGGLLVTVLALTAAGVGGWRAYEYYQARAAAEAGDRYQAAAKLAADGKTDEARAAFAAIAADAPAGYKTLARLREAAAVVPAQPAEALKIYKTVIDDPAVDPLLRDVARVRGAYVAVDVAPVDEVRRLVETLAVDGGAWRHGAREALGLAAYKAGDPAEARRQFEAIVADADAPGSFRQRADLMLSVLPAPAPATK
jgi:hypothetical protein